MEVVKTSGMRKFSRPFGTWPTLNCGPHVETLGYCRLSLRDQESTARTVVKTEMRPVRHATLELLHAEFLLGEVGLLGGEGQEGAFERAGGATLPAQFFRGAQGDQPPLM